MEKLSFLEYFILLAELVFFYCLLLFLRGAVRRGITNCATPSTSAHTHAHLLQTTPQSSSSPPPLVYPTRLHMLPCRRRWLEAGIIKLHFFKLGQGAPVLEFYLHKQVQAGDGHTPHSLGKLGGVSYKTRQQNFCTLAFVSAAIKAPIWETCL